MAASTVGEKAGLNIVGEGAGHFPLMSPRNGGVSMLCSFGEEISQTPLQFAALMSAIANGGTFFYLQYPRDAGKVAPFAPKVKRKLDIQAPICAIIPGLRAAVERGTSHRARQEEPLAGKTGTCTDNHTHLGWFGAFNDGGRRLVAVVLLRGGREATGLEPRLSRDRSTCRAPRSTSLSASNKPGIFTIRERVAQPAARRSLRLWAPREDLTS
jgi:cell division protein FtsI/penicillin-binding protein 2